jgi:hypothetical protein
MKLLSLVASSPVEASRSKCSEGSIKSLARTDGKMKSAAQAIIYQAGKQQFPGFLHAMIRA